MRGGGPVGAGRETDYGAWLRDAAGLGAFAACAALEGARAALDRGAEAALTAPPAGGRSTRARRRARAVWEG